MFVEEVINGSYGEIYLDGILLASFNECEVRDEKEYAEIRIPGTRRVKHKLMSIKGSGTIRGYRVMTDIAELNIIKDDQSDYVATLEFYLKDPENYGAKKCRISGVKFTRNDLFKFKAGEVVEEEWEFVFDEDPEFFE